MGTRSEYRIMGQHANSKSFLRSITELLSFYRDFCVLIHISIYMYTRIHTLLVKGNKIPKIGWGYFTVDTATLQHRNTRMFPLGRACHTVTTRLGLEFRTSVKVITPQATKFRPSVHTTVAAGPQGQQCWRFPTKSDFYFRFSHFDNHGQSCG